MGKAGTAADIFTWAVTVAYAASGQSPFGTGASDAILYRIMHAAPDITAVPPGLRPLVEAALAKEPRRPAHRAAVAEPADADRRAAIRRVRQRHPDHPRADLAPVRAASRRAPRPGPTSGLPRRVPRRPRVPVLAPPQGPAPGRARPGVPAGRRGHRGRSRPGRAVRRHARGRGRQHDADPAGAITPATTHSTTTAPPTSPATSTTSPATTSPASTPASTPATTTAQLPVLTVGTLLRHEANRDRLQRRCDKRGDRHHLDLVDGDRSDRHRHVRTSTAASRTAPRHRRTTSPRRSRCPLRSTETSPR